MTSNDGRWIILVVKQDNATLINCNVYGFNSHISNKTLFELITQRLQDLHNKYHDAITVLSGDLNECPDDMKDRYPSRPSQTSLNLVSSLCSNLSLTDTWRFFNPDVE